MSSAEEEQNSLAGYGQYNCVATADNTAESKIYFSLQKGL